MDHLRGNLLREIKQWKGRMRESEGDKKRKEEREKKRTREEDRERTMKNRLVEKKRGKEKKNG